MWLQMSPTALVSAKDPKGMLLAGLIGAVALLGASAGVECRDIAAIRQQFRSEMLAYERCVADIKRSGKPHELLGLAVEALCPLLPSRAPIAEAENAARDSRRVIVHIAEIVVALSSLPWLASRLIEARVK